MGGPLIAGGGIGSVVLVILYMLLGGDPSEVPVPQSRPSQSASSGAPANDEMAKFVSGTLATTEDIWREQLPAQTNVAYRDPKLVLFTDIVQSACGTAQSASGPFYCPLDEKVYIDLGFYRELRERFNAPGDFAQAYVIAHEVGHHVQTILGISEQVQGQRERSGERQGNALSVRQELQADCFAGVWAHHAQKTNSIIEPGDIEEALTAASSIGDDRIQRQTRGTVSPETFTHGSSAQRMQWFKTGFETGKVAQCDTFARM